MTGPGPRVWFVARAFPPQGAIGADRAVKWVRVLRSYGCRVRVFTVDAGAYPSELLDETRSHADLEDVDVTRVMVPGFREPLGRWKAEALRRLLMDRGWTWMRALRSALRLAATEEQPDCIIATGSPFLSFVPVRGIAQRLRVPYVLDYRDPWSSNHNAPRFPVISRALTGILERVVNRSAHAVVTVSHACAETLVGSENVHVLYNYPDLPYRREVQAIVAAARETWPFRLVFAGTLYKERDLSVIARAIKHLPPDLRSRVILDYCGASSVQASANFASEGMSAHLCDHGRVSKATAFTLTSRADVCVSLISTGEWSPNASVRGIVSTKIFDYLVMQKCVLNVGPKDNELTRLLTAMADPRVATFVSTDVEAITTFLAARLSEHAGAVPGPPGGGGSADEPSWQWETQFESFYAGVLAPALAARPGD